MKNQISKLESVMDKLERLADTLGKKAKRHMEPDKFRELVSAIADDLNLRGADHTRFVYEATEFRT